MGAGKSKPCVFSPVTECVSADDTLASSEKSLQGYEIKRKKFCPLLIIGVSCKIIQHQMSIASCYDTTGRRKMELACICLSFLSGEGIQEKKRNTTWFGCFSFFQRERSQILVGLFYSHLKVTIVV